MNHMPKKLNLELPEVGETGPFILMVGEEEDGRPEMVITLPIDYINRIHEWKQACIDREDIEFYITDVEDGYESCPMTVEQLNEHKKELLEDYQCRRDDDAHWYQSIRSTVRGYYERYVKKHDFWLCPSDLHGQRNGDVLQVAMTWEQYLIRRRTECLYLSYEAALAAAQD